MKKYVVFFFVVVFCFCQIQSFGQTNSLIHKTYSERRVLMSHFYIYDLQASNLDSVSLFKTLDSLKNLALKNSDDDLLAEVALMQIHFYAYRSNYKQEVVLKSIDSLTKVAEKDNRLWLKARLESLAGLICFDGKYNYELAFEYYQQLLITLKHLSKEEFPEKQICYMQIGNAYYAFKDWDNAIRIMKEGIAETTEKREEQFEIQILNTIGLCYQNMGNLDSSNFYLNKAIHFINPNRAEDLPWYGIVQGNIGFNYFLKKDYEKAKPLVQLDIDYADKYNDRGLQAGGLITLASINMAQNDLKNAEMNLALARVFITQSQQFSRLEKYFPVMSKLQSAKKDHQLATVYLDSTLYIKDSISKVINTLFLLRGQQKADLAQKREVEEERRIKTLERNFLIVLILFLMFVAIFIYNYQRKKYLQNQKIKDIELKAKQGELESAKNQLEDFAKSISEKSKRVEELQDKLVASPDSELSSQLLKITILTDEEWERFRKLFDRVHEGYLFRLREKLPGLSAGETRFMVFAKLKLNNKEMAATLGVSSQTIRVTWHRLRKKINLPEDGSLEELVAMI